MGLGIFRSSKYIPIFKSVSMRLADMAVVGASTA